MTDTPTFVVVGGGHAGASAVEALRDQGFTGQLILFSAEDRLPYRRPPLSKGILAGEKTLEEILIHPREWYQEHDVELRLGTAVSAIDTAAHTVTADGATQHYDKLLLATGSRPRVPDLPGADADGVHFLRTAEDAVALADAVGPGTSLGIVGAGWIGLEAAASAAGRGATVTVVESAALPLLGPLGAEAAAVFADLHRSHDVDLRLDTGVDEIVLTDGRPSGLRLSDGSTVPADVVLVAVGATPNIELAQEAGLATADGGVLVDASLVTSDPDVYAVGDIAAAEHPVLGERIRTEHWANAQYQPQVAAAGMLGRDDTYDELPYFFTDQYDFRMDYVGHAGADERTVFRGGPDDDGGGEYAVFWLDDQDRVRAGMNVNLEDGLDDIKELVGSGRTVDPQRLADTGVPLSAV